MNTLSRSKILTDLLPEVNKLFKMEYYTYTYKRPKTQYQMKFRYGKYSVYKSEYSITHDMVRSTTLATGLDKTTAVGMLKLLKDDF